MAVDMFLVLKDDGLKGESQDKVHRDSIDVLAWSWGMSQSGSMHLGGGGGAAKANFQDISLTKWIDRSSPRLQELLVTGEHVAEGRLITRRAGKTPLEFVVIEFKRVLVTSVSLGGSGGEDKLTEDVTLNFASFEVAYVEQTDDGRAGDKPEFGWDIPRNEAL